MKGCSGRRGFHPTDRGGTRPAGPASQVVEFSPLGRVEKRDHLGNTKPKGRLIHDTSGGGEAAKRERHRTSTSGATELQLPTVDRVVRKVLYWKGRYPAAEVKTAKRDVEGAFWKIPLEPKARGPVLRGRRCSARGP